MYIPLPNELHFPWVFAAAAAGTLGAVGVIGPTRLDYQRVIPLVNFTAQVLSKALDEK